MNSDEWASECRNLLILTEGFPHAAGSPATTSKRSRADSKRSSIAISQVSNPLHELADRSRCRSANHPAGGGPHSYIDARSPCHFPPLAYPGIALTNALYVEAGVRGVEIGTVMFGLHPDGTETAAPMDLVRLAIPRRVYTQSHIDYVAEAVIAVAQMADRLRGYRIAEAPKVLRHFTAAFEAL